MMSVTIIMLLIIIVQKLLNPSRKTVVSCYEILIYQTKAIFMTPCLNYEFTGVTYLDTYFQLSSTLNLITAYEHK